jgi:hypothetical protein
MLRSISDRGERVRFLYRTHIASRLPACTLCHKMSIVIVLLVLVGWLGVHALKERDCDTVVYFRQYCVPRGTVSTDSSAPLFR